RHRRAVRRFRAAHRTVDGAPPEGFLPRDEDRLADRQGGARGHLPPARSASRGPRPFDPASLARPPPRLGPGNRARGGAPGGEQGLTRFIGVTGHGWTIPVMHRRSLARFDFDSVLMPYNFFMAENERYRKSVDEVLTICRERNVAVQIIKSIARGPWATTDKTHTTWYQPLEDQADIDRAVHWVISMPGVFLNTAGDLTL